MVLVLLGACGSPSLDSAKLEARGDACILSVRTKPRQHLLASQDDQHRDAVREIADGLYELDVRPGPVFPPPVSSLTLTMVDPGAQAAPKALPLVCPGLRWYVSVSPADDEPGKGAEQPSEAFAPTGDVTMLGARLRASGKARFHTAAAAQIAIGALSLEADARGDAVVAVEDMFLQAESHLDEVVGPFETGVPITVSPPRAPPRSGTLGVPSASAVAILRGKLGRVAKGAVLFPGENENTMGTAILAVTPDAIDTLGQSRHVTLGETRFVALVESAPVYDVCGLYLGHGSDWGTMAPVSRVTEREIWRVYERRSGARRGERTFTAKEPVCPSSVKATVDQGQRSGIADLVRSATVDRAPILRWIASITQ